MTQIPTSSVAIGGYTHFKHDGLLQFLYVLKQNVFLCKSVLTKITVKMGSKI